MKCSPFSSCRFAKLVCSGLFLAAGVSSSQGQVGETPVSLEEALDGAGLVWSTSPSPGSWQGLPADATEGTSAVRAARPAAGTTTFLKTSVTGPGKLSYAWRTLGTVTSGYNATFSGSGTSASLYQSFDEWKTVNHWLGGAGPRELKWEAALFPEGTTLWLDAVHFEPATPASLTDSLDMPGATWTTGGTTNWTGMNNTPPLIDSDSAFVESLPAQGEAWVETTLSGSGTLQFRWGFPDNIHGTLEFEVNGIVHSRVTSKSWQENEIHALPPGNHTLRWRYQNPTSEITGSAWLDGISFVPGTPAADWGSATGQPALAWSGGGSRFWNPGSSPPLQAQLSYPERSLHASAAIEGPAWLNFDPSKIGLSLAVKVDGLPAVVGAWAINPSPFPSIDFTSPPVSAFVPPGRRLFTWEFYKGGQQGGRYTASLQSVSVTPVSIVPLQQALGAASPVMTNEASQPWIGLSGLGAGDDYAWLDLQSGSQSNLTFQTATPGELSITWNAIGVRGGLSNSTSVQLMVDGKTTRASSTTQTTTLTIGPGSHSIRPYLEAASPPPIAFRIYNISFTPWATVPLDVAAGTPGRLFTSGGAGWWTGLVSPALAPEGTALIWGQPAFATPVTGDSLWLETTVEGPADISFWWRVQNPVTSTRFTFSTPSLFPIQLNPFTTDAPPSISGPHRTSLGPGTHTLRWAVSGSLLPVQLDQLRITPRTVYPLDVAADLPGQVLTPVTGQWFGVSSSLALTGNSLIELRGPAGGKDAVQMTSPITGPGILRFHWRLAKPYSADEMRVMLDNKWAALLPRSNSTTWEGVTIVVPPGAHTVSWNASRAADLAAYLDGFSWQPATSALTLAEAADAQNVTGWSAPDNQWFPVADPAAASDGMDVIAVASPPGTSKALLQANCQGSGTLRYRIRQLYPEGWGLPQIFLSVNGLNYSPPALEPGTAWQERSLFLASNGPHQLEWSLANTPGSFIHYSLLLDQVSFTPATPGPSLATALDQPGWTFRTGGTHPWRSISTPAGRGGHLAAVALLPSDPGAGSWIETTLTGPGVFIPSMNAPEPGYIGWSMDGNALTADGTGVFIPGGTHTLIWGASLGGGATAATFTLDALDWYPTTWAGWQQDRFRGSGLASSQQAPEGDPDRDGLANMVEAVLGTHPLQPHDHSSLELTASIDGLYTLQFEAAAAFPEELQASVETASNPAGPWRLFSQGNPLDGVWSYPLQNALFQGEKWRNSVSADVGFSSSFPTGYWRLRVIKP